MKVVNKLRILSSVIPSLIQSCEVAGIKRAMVSFSAFGSFLHFQLDNWHFFGFILCCGSTVLWSWPNRRLLQTLLCLKGTLLLTRRHFLLSGWVLGLETQWYHFFSLLFLISFPSSSCCTLFINSGSIFQAPWAVFLAPVEATNWDWCSSWLLSAPSATPQTLLAAE